MFGGSEVQVHRCSGTCGLGDFFGTPEYRYIYREFHHFSKQFIWSHGPKWSRRLMDGSRCGPMEVARLVTCSSLVVQVAHLGLQFTEHEWTGNLWECGATDYRFSRGYRSAVHRGLSSPCQGLLIRQQFLRWLHKIESQCSRAIAMRIRHMCHYGYQAHLVRHSLDWPCSTRTFFWSPSQKRASL